MKRTTITICLVILAIIGLESLAPPTVKKDGAEPGYTGSPGDTLKNCTACHGGTAVEIDGWITSDIPEEGYEPGKRYTITATNHEAGATRFGFEISPQDLSGNLMGKMIITDSIGTKLVGDDKYITYTEYGVEGIGSLTWTFDWIAPATTIPVTFYGGFNSNFDGHKDGDKTYLSKLTVKRKGTTSVKQSNTNELDYSIYPNPATEQINIDFYLDKQSTVLVDFYNLSGKLIYKSFNKELPSGKQHVVIATEMLPHGIYLTRIQINNNTYNQKITIK